MEASPSGLEDAYHQTWKRIVDQDAGHARLAQVVLMWIVHSTRPMMIEELRRAVAACPDTYRLIPGNMISETPLLSLCHGLVVIEEDSKLVRLVREC